MTFRPIEISDQSTFDTAVTKSRAIVLVSPPWSIYSIRARDVVGAAVTQLVERSICGEDEFFILIDDEPENRNPFWAWLGFLDNNRHLVPVSVTSGAGSVIWVANGQVAHFELNANQIGVSGIIKITVNLFGERAT